MNEVIFYFKLLNFGIVSDSYLLMDYSDVNLFVVKLNFTNKKFFVSLVKDIEMKEIASIWILLNNDEDKSTSSYYGNTGIEVSYLKR
jgi:hypothetical protein